MTCQIDSYRTFLTTSRGILRIPHLAQLLDSPVQYAYPWLKTDKSMAVVAWGLRPTAIKAQRFAEKHNLPLIRLEDGFLRSVGLGKTSPPLSIVIDDVGIYYSASQASRLEQLVAQSLSSAQLARTKALIQAWQKANVSKYNQARDYTGTLPKDYVLVVDQTYGDMSIERGLADADSFQTMLNSALAENPHSTILLKVHPDVVSGYKTGHFDLSALAQEKRIQLLAEEIHPASLLAQAQAVYCVTSQMGFEALLWGKPVRVFGMPFYAGWGLTQDELPAPKRRCAVSLEQLVYAALIAYPRYFNPETQQACEVEDLVQWLSLQRQMRQRFPEQLSAYGFSLYKRPIVRRFFAGSEIHFVKRLDTAGVQKLAFGHKKASFWTPIIIWANNRNNNFNNKTVLRLEDGFIRSVGLGADLIPPLSWVIDSQGIYYDATCPSDLESILQNTLFDDVLLNRAENLRQQLVSLGITKYNLISGQSIEQLNNKLANIHKVIILVVGQVESDASIKYGSPIIKTNLALLKQVKESNPQAYIIYKPHPDVIAGLREQGTDEAQSIDYCDEIITDIAMAELLPLIHEVHTMTSLTGFEALLRGKKVVCYGQPFYAGWGLTEDKYPITRRTRKLTLAELIAGTLILYPTYVSRITQQFTTPEQALVELVSWRSSYTKMTLWQRILRLLLKLEIKLKKI